MKISRIKSKLDNQQVTSSSSDYVVSFSDMPAKIYNDKEQNAILSYSLYAHSLDVAGIAKELISNMPKRLHSLFKNAEFVVACHDVGKLSPCFFIKITKDLLKEKKLAQDIYDNLFLVNKEIDYAHVAKVEKDYGYHSTLSYDEFLELFPNKYALAKVIMRHHGYEKSVYCYAINQNKYCGGKGWHEQRQALLKILKDKFDVNFEEDISESKSLLWSGLTAVSDWIASDFSFFKMSFQNLSLDEKSKIAIDKNGLTQAQVRRDLQFGDIFSFNQVKYKINNLQQVVLDQVRAGGSLFIIEAPMGKGKTEAALYAAYELLQTQKARGIYFALPSRITSDTMCVRLNNFLDKILTTEDNKNRNAFVIYGKQGLLDHVGADAAFAAKDESGVETSWFSNSKRKFLANFAVGTLDQALLAVLPSKFNFVRYFGLAGKVVIIDEVHSYDMFSSTLLEVLIQRLLEAKCIVLLLSATLTLETKARLLRKDISEFKKQGSLLISCLDENNNVKQSIVHDDFKKTYKLKHIQVDDILDCVYKHAKAGDYVLMIENTVSNAQNLYLKLKSLAQDIEVILLHSRFVYADKFKIQAHVLKLLGKSRKRTKGVVVIGTQILEQSLDIDADVLFTNIAPIDLLFQRIGRCHRFNDPDRKSDAIVYVYGTDISKLEEKSYNIFDNSKYIYDPYILARTAICLQTLNSLSVPHDIGLLLEQVYKNQEESGVLAELKYYSQYGSKDLGNIGSNNLRLEALENLYACNEASMTRYSTTASIAVLIMSSLDFSFDNDNIYLKLSDHSYSLRDIKLFSKAEQSSIVEYLEKHIIYLSNYNNRYNKYRATDCFIKNFKFNVLLDHVYYYAKIDKDDRVVFIQNINMEQASPYKYSSQYGFMKDS